MHSFEFRVHRSFGFRVYIHPSTSVACRVLRHSTAGILALHPACAVVRYELPYFAMVCVKMTLVRGYRYRGVLHRTIVGDGPGTAAVRLSSGVDAELSRIAWESVQLLSRAGLHSRHALVKLTPRLVDRQTILS